MKKTARFAAAALSLVIAGGCVLMPAADALNTAVYADTDVPPAKDDPYYDRYSDPDLAVEVIDFNGTELDTAPVSDEKNTDKADAKEEYTPDNKADVSETEKAENTAEAPAQTGAPTGLTASPTETSVTLKWDAVDGADAYRVYQYDREQKKFLKIKTIKGTAAVVKDLITGEKYYFKVAALSKDGKKYNVLGTSEKIGVKAEKPAPAQNGLVYKKGRTYYYKNGQPVTGLQFIDGYYYYFNPDEYDAAMREWVQIDDDYYYFTDSGRAATGSRTIDDKKYSFEKDGRCINYEQVTRKAVKKKGDTTSSDVKPPELPDPKTVNLSGSSTKCSITVKCGPKDNKTDQQAKDEVNHALAAFRFKIVAKYGQGSVKFTTMKADNNKYDAYYDIIYKGVKVYSYHEYWELKPGKQCTGTIEITKS